MRRFFSVTCLTAATLLTPFAAHAATIDDVSITGPGLSVAYFSPNPIVVAHSTDKDVVFGARVNATINGDANYFLSPIYGLAGGSEGNVSVIVLATSTDGSTPYNLTFYGPQLVQLLSQGPLNDTFELTPGTYGVSEDSSAPNAYTLTVTPEGTAVTPEPASLTLLSTGATGVVSALRRRRRLSHPRGNA